MLNLPTSAVGRAEQRVSGQVSPQDPIWEGTGVELVEPLDVDLTARSVGQGILARGSMHAVLEQECRRCLEPVRVELDEPVEMLFEPLSAEEADELGGEVYDLPRAAEVDLRPALREELLLRIPEHVLCRPECRGLCARCGTDLNRTACDCEPEGTGSPWDVLKTLEFD